MLLSFSFKVTNRNALSHYCQQTVEGCSLPCDYSDTHQNDQTCFHYFKAKFFLIGEHFFYRLLGYIPISPLPTYRTSWGYTAAWHASSVASIYCASVPPIHLVIHTCFFKCLKVFVEFSINQHQRFACSFKLFPYLFFLGFFSKVDCQVFIFIFYYS